MIFSVDAFIHVPRHAIRCTASLAVACNRCSRSGRYYSLDALITRYGAGFGIPELLRELSDDCPKQKSLSAYVLCGVHCPDLPALFMPRPG